MKVIGDVVSVFSFCIVRVIFLLFFADILSDVCELFVNCLLKLVAILFAVV